MASRRTGRRAAGVVLLLLGAAALLRPGGGPPAGGTGLGLGLDRIPMGVALACGVLAAGCVIVVVHALILMRGGGLPPRRARGAPNLLARVAVLSLCAALLLSPLGSLLLDALREVRNPIRPPITTSAPPQAPGPAAAGRSGDILSQLVGVGAVAVLLTVLGAATLRRLRAPAGPRHESADAQLARAATAGAAALDGDGDEGADSRQRVIGCYAAMEQVLAAGGAARRASDTPDELLARAAAAGLYDGEAARVLTELFRRARFGRSPMDAADVAAARAALTALQAGIVPSGAPR